MTRKRLVHAAVDLGHGGVMRTDRFIERLAARYVWTRAIASVAIEVDVAVVCVPADETPPEQQLVLGSHLDTKS